MNAGVETLTAGVPRDLGPATGRNSFEDLCSLIDHYNSPSEAYWRFFELSAVRSLEYAHPILEVGCGDGLFTRMAFDTIEDAIDINPRAVERSRRSGVYERVRCMDARELSTEPAVYGTVFANCVLEHIPYVDRVLSASRVALRPGGRLVATVPLQAMNQHMTLPSDGYTRLRQRQLSHANLWTQEQWRKVLTDCGFTTVVVVPYLFGSQCLLWDRIDAIACLGARRYRLGAAYRLFRERALPRLAQERLTRAIARHLWNQAEKNPSGAACAALVVAM